jgi:hypothetical protein
MLSVELNKTIFFLLFDFIRSGIEYTTELICEEHIYHYTTDSAVD